eukprot:6482305-Pyramimonas_sp.AAC.1
MKSECVRRILNARGEFWGGSGGGERGWAAASRIQKGALHSPACGPGARLGGHARQRVCAEYSLSPSVIGACY